MLLNIKELAVELKVSVGTVYAWVHHRKIPFIKVGRHLRFDYEEVLNSFKAKSNYWQSSVSGLSTNPRSLTFKETEKWRRVSSTKGDSTNGTSK